MYAPCVYLSSISCVNRLPPGVISRLSALARTGHFCGLAGGDPAVKPTRPTIESRWVCVPMRGTRPGVSYLNRLGSHVATACSDYVRCDNTLFTSLISGATALIDRVPDPDV